MSVREGLLVVLLAVCTIAKPPPFSSSPWISAAGGYAGKPVYSRALGPPTVGGIDTISVPFVPKTSPFFPKFVDPKTMISKKTDMLSNMFAGSSGSFYPAGVPKPFFPFQAGTPSLYASEYAFPFDSSKSAEGFPESPDANSNTVKDKRGMLSPVGPKFGPAFGPFAPATKFSPFSPFASPFAPFPSYPFANPLTPYGSESGSVDSSLSTSRKRRDLDPSTLANVNKPEVSSFGPPPAYPGLATIAEEPETDEKVSGTPKQYLPGMFGPFSPYAAAFSPVVDPSMFISKKSTFLDTLFKTIATTTTAAPEVNPAAVTETPVPKSTIVPADFWAPSAIIPGPAEYNQKVSAFLEKLFDSLTLNKTADSTAKVARSVDNTGNDESTRVARTLQDLTAISAAKDTIVDSIITELSELKSGMVKTMSDLIAYEKTTSPTAPGAKKPFKPPFASIWAKPAVDGTLQFQQKLAVLSQVFDMLTDLQKNITVAVQSAIKDSADQAQAPTSETSKTIVEDSYGSPYNLSFFDALVKRMSAMDTITPYAYSSDNPATSKLALRALPKTSLPFWQSYPVADGSNVFTKRSASNDIEALINEAEVPKEYSARAVNMQLHQGYQSLPAGTVESVQAGGGSTPGHQGGGINLLDNNDYGEWEKYADWTQRLSEGNQGNRRHQHHNHH
ncbi:uncharacterized protein [Prorops nasuta]|uniref:uncharacterized protein n=1 Tax=Prorops nasuta TaxID=863751 RepID=UPI0034CF76E8